VHPRFGKLKNACTLFPAGCQRSHLALGKGSERLGSCCDDCVGLHAHIYSYMLFACVQAASGPPAVHSSSLGRPQITVSNGCALVQPEGVSMAPR
jgi:hypothetical protein